MKAKPFLNHTEKLIQSSFILQCMTRKSNLDIKLARQTRQASFKIIASFYFQPIENSVDSDRSQYGFEFFFREFCVDIFKIWAFTVEN